MELPRTEGAKMDRSTLATAQVLPALKRTVVNQPDNQVATVATDACRLAARLARESAPMYEGCYTYAQLYVGNLGIITARVSEPGCEE